MGWNVIRKAKVDWIIFGTFLSNPLDIPDCTLIKADLTKFDDLQQLFNRVKPDAVIHTAAVSDPNFCQKHPLLSHDTNTIASLNIAGLCADLAIPCVFTSSDLIFDGLHPPYSEDDEPSPVSAYGEQKVLAELEMKKRYPETVICRMPLMFGDSGPVAASFLQPMLKTMRAGNDINLFTDEYRTPVSGETAAEGLMIALNTMPGVIHLGGRQRISRFEFARLVSKIFQIPQAVLNPCRQKDIDMPAPRPPDVSLDSSKAMALGFKPGSLSVQLQRLQDKWPLRKGC